MHQDWAHKTTEVIIAITSCKAFCAAVGDTPITIDQDTVSIKQSQISQENGLPEREIPEGSDTRDAEDGQPSVTTPKTALHTTSAKKEERAYITETHERMSTPGGR